MTWESVPIIENYRIIRSEWRRILRRREAKKRASAGSLSEPAARAARIQNVSIIFLTCFISRRLLDGGSLAARNAH